MSILETTDSKIEDALAYDLFRFQHAWGATDADSVQALLHELNIQEDGWTCHTTSSALLAKSFQQFDKTTKTLDTLRDNSNAVGAAKHPGHDGLRALRGAKASGGLSAGHLKHMQDKKDSGKLGKHTARDPSLGAEVVNKRWQTTEARYRSPGNLKSVTTRKGQEVHSESAREFRKKWAARATAELQELRKQPDGGAAEWRKACVRMSPVVLDGGRVTDRFVGLGSHPQAKKDEVQLSGLNQKRSKELYNDNVAMSIGMRTFAEENMGRAPEPDEWFKEAALDDQKKLKGDLLFD